MMPEKGTVEVYASGFRASQTTKDTKPNGKRNKSEKIGLVFCFGFVWLVSGFVFRG